MRAVSFGGFALFALCLTGGARASWVHWWPLLGAPAESALPGLRVDGTALNPGEPVRSQIEARARALRDRRVRIVMRADGGPRVLVESTFGALGVSVDVEAAASRVMRLGRSEDVLTRACLADRARRGELDIPLQPTIDTHAALELLLPLKEDLDIAPANARFDVERHTTISEREGRALDVDETIATVARAAADKSAVDADVVFARVAPHVTSASLSRLDVSRVISSFSTYFSRHGDQAARAQNIEVAASHIDGLVLEPGELVSFNDLVGARSEDNGFQKAFEIYKGEMVEGTGGGTCQVASTLHAAAFFGGLDIVQRLPHSRPSAYIPVGLDATVVYPVVDLELRNPYGFPVVVHATVEANRVTMQLLGADKLARVALMRTVLETMPFDRKVIEDSGISKPKRKQKGQDGLKLLRKRLIAMRGGRSKVETSRDTYPPTSEIWKVPNGYDESQLPPLGEDLPDPDHPNAAPEPRRASDPEKTIWGG